MSNLADIKRTCPQCGREFQIRSNNQKYCCMECSKEHIRLRKKMTRMEVNRWMRDES